MLLRDKGKISIWRIYLHSSCKICSCSVWSNQSLLFARSEFAEWRMPLMHFISIVFSFSVKNRSNFFYRFSTSIIPKRHFIHAHNFIRRQYIIIEFTYYTQLIMNIIRTDLSACSFTSAFQFTQLVFIRLH